jgi:probable rRNA maturation factor
MTSPKKDAAIAIRIRRNFTGVDVSLPRLRKLVRIVCMRFGGRQGFEAYEISIAIVDDAEITKLNARFLARSAATDCLSFDLSDAKTPHPDTLNSRILELIVNGEMAARQAALRGHSGETELALYVTHGLLHNFGFDDCTPEQARKMHNAEDTILQEFGYGLVYSKDIVGAAPCGGPGQARGPAPTV